MAQFLENGTVVLVERGDCLWNIAAASELLGYNGARWREIAEANNISGTTIYPNQRLTIPTGGSTPPVSTNNTIRPNIDFFGLLAGTGSDSTSWRDMMVTWLWDRTTDTENYRVMWYQRIGGIWVIGEDTEIPCVKDGVEYPKVDTYTADASATEVKVKILPKSKMNTVNNVETAIFTADWSEEQSYDFSQNNPSAPASAPSVKIEDYTLTAELSNIDTDLNATQIEFQVVRDHTMPAYSSGLTNINNDTRYASYSCTVEAGSIYEVRCRSKRDDKYSAWTEYSSSAGAMPSAPSEITKCEGGNRSEIGDGYSVVLEWTSVPSATSYDIEYATDVGSFDNTSDTIVINDIKNTTWTITKLSGDEYFFRVRAVNEHGESPWSGIKSVAVGQRPAQPTTWSYINTAMHGERVPIYWIHNSQDGSNQTMARVQLIINDVELQCIDVPNSTDDDGGIKITDTYTIDTGSLCRDANGNAIDAKIVWKVKTKGVTNEYSDWSTPRIIDVYAPAVLSGFCVMVPIPGDPDGREQVVDTITSFPFTVSGIAGSKPQVPIGYHLSITSNESYETIDQVGRSKKINAGEEVYSKYFDVPSGSSLLKIKFSADNIDLENNITYTATGTVTMNSGLNATNSTEFKVRWTDMQYVPNAEIGIDKDTLSAYIRPYCIDQNGTCIQDVYLSVYRREFDGGFVEIATNIDHTKNTFVTDPHPALDYARYRIVAITKSTGAVSYYDVPGYPINEKAAVIQWNEAWSNFDAVSDGALEDNPWSGSMLKLKYNLDVSDKGNNDVEHIEYIGRKHPVSYYGTQLGETQTWNVSIPKNDKETLYALRRLKSWMDDVYVREPSGSGYWASISVTFSQTHNELTIPVSIDITRVEGGM